MHRPRTAEGIPPVSTTPPTSGDCDDDADFRALLAHARHITSRVYETTLYDHMQAFRHLWRRLESTGHLRRMREAAPELLASGTLTAAEVADLELFLTVHAAVRGT
jgi:hypothetical protein